MSTTPAPKQDDDKATKAFFAVGADKKERVALYLDDKNPNWEPGRPAMFGKIDGKNVSVFVEPAGTSKDGKPYGTFLSINEKGAKLEDGSYAKDTKLATANLRSTEEGATRMVIKMGEETIWATPRKEVSMDLMAKGGLDLDKLNEKRAAAAQKAANGEGGKKKAAPGM